MGRRKERSAAIIAALLIAVMVLNYISTAYFESNLSLTAYTFYVICDETVLSSIVWILFIYVIYLMVQRGRGAIDVRYKPLICAGAIIAVFAFNLFTPLSDKYSGIVADGKRPSKKIEYYKVLVEDMISNETENNDLKVTDVDIGYHKIKRRSGRVMHSVMVYDISYFGTDEMANCCYITEQEKKILALVLDTYDSVTLTYYKHSGVLKCINGVEVGDSEAILNQVALYKAINGDYER